MNAETQTTPGKVQKDLATRISSILSKNRMFLAVVAVLYLLPLVTGAEFSPERDLLNIITQIMIFGLLAMSFDLQLGRAGLLNFGQVALFGVGAYFTAFTLNNTVFPGLNAMPFPVTIILSMLVGAGLGFIMGLTTSRMKGTAFAFIALAIAMFLYNFFAQNSWLSGGETGLLVSVPQIYRMAPTYIAFVAVAFIVLALFFGMMALYVRGRTESVSLLFFTPVMIALIGAFLYFGANIIGTILVSTALLFMLLLNRLAKAKSRDSPLEFAETITEHPENPKSLSTLTARILSIAILGTAIGGVLVGFGGNIVEMVFLWVTRPGDIYLYRIPVQYYLVLSCVVVVFLFVKRLVASPFGRMVTAVAQNEERAEALGYNSYLAKIVVVVLSGAIAALSGALYAPYIRTIDPTTGLGVEVSIDAMLYTIIGGIGTLFGPLLGSGVVVYSELNLVDVLGELWLVGLGVAYVIIVLFLPLGIVGSASTKTRTIKEKLQRVKLGRFEFGMREMDYWAIALLGALAVVFQMLMITMGFLTLLLVIYYFIALSLYWGVVVFSVGYLVYLHMRPRLNTTQNIGAGG
jgi:ABC-type branched-subunit amino acid transport system permease subunit